MKRNIEVNEYLKEIINGVNGGALITVRNGEKVNCMTIGWGQIGIEWGKMIFTAFVRTGRHTHGMLEQSGEFTVNIAPEIKQSKILGYCGTKSGRDHDKVKDLQLTLVEGDAISAPGIKELPLTLECKIIYQQLQDKDAIPEDIRIKHYPENKPSDFCGGNRDYHTMFFGEIVGAYMVE